MRIIKPQVKILSPLLADYKEFTRDHGIKLLRYIERQARVSHRAEGRQTPETWERFIQDVVLDRADWSVTEHASLSVEFRIARSTAFELVRHRLFSYTQESTRFVNGRKSYPNGLEFIRPVELPGLTYPYENAPQFDAFEKACHQSEDLYLGFLDQRIRPQEARSVLPNAMACTIVMTGNLRSWRWFFLMRTTTQTHPDMREVTVPLLEEFQRVVPLLYDDIRPNSTQKQNQGLAK